MNHAMLMMGGAGTRFGADVPKQFVEVDGRPVFLYILEKYDVFPEVDDILLVCHESWVSGADEWARQLGGAKYIGCIAGGATRAASVANGLVYLAATAADDDLVLIHDATHPYLDEDATREAIAAAREFGAATLGQKQYDTVYRTDGADNITEVVPREEFVSGALPEILRFGMLRGIYAGLSQSELERHTSAGALALVNGVRMKVIPTELLNLKITYRRDMELFERLLHGYYCES